MIRCTVMRYIPLYAVGVLRCNAEADASEIVFFAASVYFQLVIIKFVIIKLTKLFLGQYHFSTIRGR